jgi:hypothetical protein
MPYSLARGLHFDDRGDKCAGDPGELVGLHGAHYPSDAPAGARISANNRAAPFIAAHLRRPRAIRDVAPQEHEQQESFKAV